MRTVQPSKSVPLVLLAALTGQSAAFAQTTDPAPSHDAVSLLRRSGEACFIGAGTGGASVMLSTILNSPQGLAPSSLFGIAVGAAGFGCAVGFAGATAAAAFGYLWEETLAPTLHDWVGGAATSPPPPPPSAAP